MLKQTCIKNYIDYIKIAAVSVVSGFWHFYFLSRMQDRLIGYDLAFY